MESDTVLLICFKLRDFDVAHLGHCGSRIGSKKDAVSKIIDELCINNYILRGSCRYTGKSTQQITASIASLSWSYPETSLMKIMYGVFHSLMSRRITRTK